MLFKASAVFLEVRGEFAFYSPNRSSLKTTSIIFHMQLVFIRKPWLQAFRGLFFFFPFSLPLFLPPILDKQE